MEKGSVVFANGSVVSGRRAFAYGKGGVSGFGTARNMELLMPRAHPEMGGFRHVEKSDRQAS